MKSWLYRLSLFTMLIVVGYTILNKNNLSISNIKVYIENYREFAMIIIIIIAIIRPFFLMPITALCIVTGLTLSFHLSVLVTVFSMWISSTLVYYLSRLFSDDICNYIKKPKYVRVLSRIREKEFKIILLARLSMLVHYDVLSVLAGIAKVSYKKYILASFLGFIPEILIYSSLSFATYNVENLRYIIPLILLFFGITVFFRKNILM